MTGMVGDRAARQYFMECFEAAGVHCIFQNAGEESNDVEILLKRLARYTWVVDHLPVHLRRGIAADDIVQARQEGRRCLYLSTNGVPVPRDFRNLDEALAAIRVFYQLGVRMMHLTYNRRNLIGDGCAESSDGGLSDFGRAVVGEMNRCGVIVDIAHSGPRTGLDAAKASAKPMVISHAVCGALSPHCRAKSDDLMKAVAETDGYIGICCLPMFLQGSGDITAFLNHIQHAVKSVGAQHVAIGTDLSAPQATGYDTQPPVLGRRVNFEKFWSADDELFNPHWFQKKMQQSLAWTNWPLFTVGMVQRGLTDDQIQMILGQNALRVAGANMFGASSAAGSHKVGGP